MEQLINEVTGEVIETKDIELDSKDKLIERIVKANDEVTMTNIKGKLYAQVWQRVKAFRKVHPLGCIKTEIVAQGDNLEFVRMKAYVYDKEGGNLLGMSEHIEKKVNTNKPHINNIDILGNCETSVVGRALGFAGFMGNGEIASAEDMNKVENMENTGTSKSNATQQDFSKIPATPEQITKIKAEIDEGRLSNILFAIGVAKLEDLNVKQASDIIGGKYNG